MEDDPGTYRWMAPEMCKRKPYGPKVDVYSFGLVLWELVSGSIPYEEMTPLQAAYAVVNETGCSFELPDTIATIDGAMLVRSTREEARVYPDR